MQSIRIQTDENQREIFEHETVQFPLMIKHDHLNDYFERYVCCHWHEDFEIAVILQGNMCYQVKDHSFNLNPGDGKIGRAHV